MRCKPATRHPQPKNHRHQPTPSPKTIPKTCPPLHTTCQLCPCEKCGLAFFARHMATLGYEPWHFDGALLWVHQFGIWNLAVEGIGYRVVEQMNRAAGQPAAFETSQGHEFRADELTETVAALLQPMIFSWDTYYLPQWSWGTGEFFIFISHDSYVVVVTKTKAFHDKVFAELEKMNYNPEVPPEGWCERFCRRTSVS